MMNEKLYQEYEKLVDKVNKSMKVISYSEQQITALNFAKQIAKDNIIIYKTRINELLKEHCVEFDVDEINAT